MEFNFLGEEQWFQGGETKRLERWAERWKKERSWRPEATECSHEHNQPASIRGERSLLICNVRDASLLQPENVIRQNYFSNSSLLQLARKHGAGGGRHTDAVEELKNAFELAERSSPGITNRWDTLSYSMSFGQYIHLKKDSKQDCLKVHVNKCEVISNVFL